MLYWKILFFDDFDEPRYYENGNLMAVTSKLTWANIDVTDPAELEAMRAQEAAEATRRAEKAITELQQLGILDAKGRRIRKDLPPDMQEDSGCDMSAL
jgi:hypothetical protein